MAKSIGIDAGDYAIKAVEIDGSYRKTRLLRHAVQRVPDATDGQDRAATVAAAISATLSENKFAGDLVLGHPCREAALRTIDVPFTGKEAIRKVIKAEVEGAVQGQSVEDMVVDFLEVEKSSAGGAKVLVAAVPKQGLRAVLDGLRKGGFEPERVDMDTMALFRAADWCGAFTPDDSVPVAAGDAATAAATTIVLDLGARSTRVLVVRGEQLVDMRSIRLGDASVAEGIARTHSLALAEARTAAEACIATGGDWTSEVASAAPVAAAAEGGDAVPAVATRQITVSLAEVANEQRLYLQRLSRELMRFLASQGRSGGVQRLWITGGGCRVEGMAAMLTEVFGLAPRELDPFANLQHSLSPEEVETLRPQIATALGLALAQFGGPEGFQLRQEDLAFTRGFERVKFPLAIACMVALFAAIVQGVRLNNDLKNLQIRVGAEFIDPKQGPLFWGQMNAILANWEKDSAKFQLRENGKDYKKKDLLRDLAAMPVAARVKFFHDKLSKFLVSQQQQSGIYEDLSLESGLAVLVRFFEVLKRAEDQGLGRFLLCKFDLGMKATGSGDKSGRFVKFTIAIRGNDFRERESRLREAFESECQQPDSPFQKYDALATKESLFTDSVETGVKGAYFDITLVVRESFSPFGGAKQ